MKAKAAIDHVFVITKQKQKNKDKKNKETIVSVEAAIVINLVQSVYRL